MSNSVPKGPDPDSTILLCIREHARRSGNIETCPREFLKFAVRSKMKETGLTVSDPHRTIRTCFDRVEESFGHAREPHELVALKITHAQPPGDPDFALVVLSKRIHGL